MRVWQTSLQWPINFNLLMHSPACVAKAHSDPINGHLDGNRDFPTPILNSYKQFKIR